MCCTARKWQRFRLLYTVVGSGSAEVSPAAASLPLVSTQRGFQSPSDPPLPVQAQPLPAPAGGWCPWALPAALGLPTWLHCFHWLATAGCLGAAHRPACPQRWRTPCRRLALQPLRPPSAPWHGRTKHCIELGALQYSMRKCPLMPSAVPPAWCRSVVDHQGAPGGNNTSHYQMLSYHKPIFMSICTRSGV